jgi:hypothetical protein
LGVLLLIGLLSAAWVYNKLGLWKIFVVNIFKSIGINKYC